MFFVPLCLTASAFNDTLYALLRAGRCRIARLRIGRAGIAALLVGALVILIYAPTLRWLALAWWQDPYYSHGWLVPPVSAALAWRQRAVWRERQPANAGLLFLALGVALYILGWLLSAQFVAAFSLLPVLGGLAWTFLGARAARTLAFPIAFLAFAVPLPWVEAWTVPLESLTAGGAAGLVQLAGVPVTVVGGQVHLPSCDLVVGAACSGMRSLIALLALGALLAYLLRGWWGHRLAVGLAALPLALLGNVLRVTMILVVAHRAGAGAATLAHDLIGPAFFFAALALLLLLGWVLGLRLE